MSNDFEYVGPFVDAANNFLTMHPKHEQHARLERFVKHLESGEHPLPDPLTVEEFLSGYTHQQYLAALAINHTLGLHDPRLKEHLRKHFHYTSHARRWVVRCKTECYVGQGMDFSPGEELVTFYSLEEGEEKLAVVNADPWCIDCWELVELPPTLAPNHFEGE